MTQCNNGAIRKSTANAAAFIDTFVLTRHVNHAELIFRKQADILSHHQGVMKKDFFEMDHSEKWQLSCG